MATPKAKTYLDKAGIEKGIKSIAARGLTLDKDIQLVGESVLAHIAQHKEVSLFKKLYDSLPKGSRSNALVAWAIGFGQVGVNLDKKTNKEMPFIYVADKVTDLEGAGNKPWFDFKKPKAPADEFNFEAEVAQFQAKIQAWIKAEKVSPTDHLAIAVLSAKPAERSAEVVTGE